MRGVIVTFVLLCSCLAAACGGEDKPAAADKPAATDNPPADKKAVTPTAAPDAAQDPPPAPAANPLSVGMKVKFPVRDDRVLDVEILALYGKLALVQYQRDQVGKNTASEEWVDAGRLEPKGIPEQLPAGDTCQLSAGQQVKCPFLNDRRRYPGRITEVHGKMVNVRYDDGDVGWNFCTECKIR